MAPINLPDGSQVSEIVLPDGSTASEVLAPDGSTVFSAIPDDGLLHNYDARELSLNDGDSVSSWPDSKGSDDLSQTTSADQPTYRTDEVAGRPAVVSDGSDFMTTSFSSTITQPFDVFVVGRIDSASGEQSPFGSTDVVEMTAQFGDDFYDAFAGGVISGGSPTADKQLLTLQANGTDSAIRKNRSDIATGDLGTNDMTMTDVFRSANDTGRLWDDAIAHILWYDASASGYSQSDVEDFLEGVWGPF